MALDLNTTPNREIPKWSETRWSGSWNPDEGVGIYLHMGRFRKDLEVWWIQTVAYLPDGKLAVDRAWARQPDDAAIRTGNFELAQKENGWTSSFDGGAELTTSEELAVAPHGSGAPWARMRWELSAEASSPVWDVGKGLAEQAGDSHVQQGFRTTGSLTVDDATYSLDGVGYKDHSSGVRAWDTYGGHNFTLIHMPDWTAHLVTMHGVDGEPTATLGAFFRDGEEHRIESFEMPVVADAFGGPNRHELALKPAGEEEIELDVEILHQCPVSVTDDGDNINGIDWEASSQPVVLYMEAAASFTAPDGAIGYGFHERGIRRDTLARPTEAPAVAVTQS